MLVNVSGELLASFVSAGKAGAVLDVTVTDISLTKSFTDDPVPPGGSVTLEFTIHNFSRDETATNIDFTDALPAGASATGLPTSSICGAGSSLSGTTTLTFSDGVLAPETSCTFSVALDVPAMTAPGSYSNTTSAVTADLGGSPTTGNMASDTLFVFPAPVLTKEFIGDPVGAGDDVVIRFTITNTSSSMATDIEFIDELTDGGPMTGFLSFPVSVTLPPTPDPPCNGTGSLALISVETDRQGLELTGGELVGDGMCTFDVTVSIPVGFPPGTYTNTTGVITADIGGTVTGNPVSDDVVIVAPPPRW